MNEEVYRQALKKGGQWLLEQQNPDGSVNAVEGKSVGIYKMPWALNAAGHNHAASSLFRWLRRSHFPPDGDFVGSYLRPQLLEEIYPYPNSWLVVGAHRLGLFDISLPGASFLISLQDTETGGFYVRRNQSGSKARQVLWVSAMAGLALLHVGRIGLAEKVGGFLQRTYEAQPNIERQLYLAYTVEDGLVTNFPAQEARTLVVRADETNQLFYAPGAITVFLVYLARATGQKEWVELARKYVAFSQSCTQAMYSDPYVGKVGWGAALLYDATGEEQYRLLALRVADFLVGIQSPEGRWPVPGTERQAYPLSETAEYMVILDAISSALKR